MLCVISELRRDGPLGVAGDGGNGEARHPMLFDDDIGDEKYSMSGHVEIGVHDALAYGV